MADKKLCSVYGVVELNNIAGVRTGELVSQYEMSAEQLENGMLVSVNHATELVGLPTDKTETVYLHASVEKEYEGRGRKHYVNKKGSFLPRAYKLAYGDTFETNAVLFDKASVDALGQAITADAGFGVADTTGYIRFVDALEGTEKVALKAVKMVVLPNGEMGIKFRVIKAVA